MRKRLSGSRMVGSEAPDAKMSSGSRKQGAKHLMRRVVVCKVNEPHALDSSGLRSHSNIVVVLLLFLLQVLCTMFIALH